MSDQGDPISWREYEHAEWEVPKIRLSCDDADDELPPPEVITQLPDAVLQSYREQGFLVLPRVLSMTAVEELRTRLDRILQGDYPTGVPPDKIPTIKHLNPLGPNAKKRVLQLINVHKSDPLYRELALHPVLGRLLQSLLQTNTPARLAQDQIWAKPPGSPALSFHRDSPYFMFQPSSSIVTVWVALDDMRAEKGPLVYAPTSHRWTNASVLASKQFFVGRKDTCLLEQAAKEEGVAVPPQLVTLADVPAGSLAIHDGNLWHGSGPNRSPTEPRRGLGLHYCPGNVQWTAEAQHSSLWRNYNRNEPVPEEDFPYVKT